MGEWESEPESREAPLGRLQNFMPTSTVTKSEDSQFTYVFPCFLVETFRYFIPRVVSF